MVTRVLPSPGVHNASHIRNFCKPNHQTIKPSKSLFGFLASQLRRGFDAGGWSWKHEWTHAWSCWYFELHENKWQDGIILTRWTGRYNALRNENRQWRVGEAELAARLYGLRHHRHLNGVHIHRKFFRFFSIYSPFIYSYLLPPSAVWGSCQISQWGPG